MGKTKRGKGSKIMAIADRRGLPVAVHIESATPHEVSLPRAALRCPSQALSSCSRSSRAWLAASSNPGATSFSAGIALNETRTLASACSAVATSNVFPASDRPRDRRQPARVGRDARPFCEWPRRCGIWRFAANRSSAAFAVSAAWPVRPPPRLSLRAAASGSLSDSSDVLLELAFVFLGSGYRLCRCSVQRARKLVGLAPDCRRPGLETFDRGHQASYPRLGLFVQGSARRGIRIEGATVGLDPASPRAFDGSPLPVLVPPAPGCVPAPPLAFLPPARDHRGAPLGYVRLRQPCFRPPVFLKGRESSSSATIARVLSTQGVSPDLEVRHLSTLFGPRCHLVPKLSRLGSEWAALRRTQIFWKSSPY